MLSWQLLLIVDQSPVSVLVFVSLPDSCDNSLNLSSGFLSGAVFSVAYFQ